MKKCSKSIIKKEKKHSFLEEPMSQTQRSTGSRWEWIYHFRNGKPDRGRDPEEHAEEARIRSFDRDERSNGARRIRGKQKGPVEGRGARDPTPGGFGWRIQRRWWTWTPGRTRCG